MHTLFLLVVVNIEVVNFQVVESAQVNVRNDAVQRVR